MNVSACCRWFVMGCWMRHDWQGAAWYLSLPLASACSALLFEPCVQLTVSVTAAGSRAWTLLFLSTCRTPPPPLENLIWIQLLVFALGLKKPQWGSPSGTKVCADVRGGWVGGLWTRRRRGRLGCSPAISGYGRREWSTLGQGLGVGNQRQSVLRKSGTADALALALTKIRTYQTPIDLVSFWFIICGYIRLVLCLGYGTYLRSSLS